ncbi:hypothetical protein [Natronococcus wangiae]|uniref:hypothetical protein n=1 Tax=Natronococcus wangiae TaxID=3068275 RepID=UPI00273EAA61|nr:hypothetical protein [Natronococcus sp. AD5]
MTHCRISDERFEQVERVVVMHCVEMINNPVYGSYTSPKRLRTTMESEIEDIPGNIREQELGYIFKQLDFLDKISPTKYRITEKIGCHELVVV